MKDPSLLLGQLGLVSLVSLSLRVVVEITKAPGGKCASAARRPAVVIPKAQIKGTMMSGTGMLLPYASLRRSSSRLGSLHAALPKSNELWHLGGLKASKTGKP